MKRILSVILSLALLASALIIPMSVSAEGELTSQQAAQNLIDAVDDLELDVDAARQNGLLTEAAYPVGSQTSPAAGEANVDKNSGINISDTEKDLVSKIGSKSVSVTENVAITANGWGLYTSDLHALRYQYSSTIGDVTGYFRLKEIGYIVLYVKTNRAFKLGMSVHNNAKTARIAAGRDVPVTGSGYEAIIVDVLDFDLTTIASGYCSNNPNWGFFPAIESFTEGNQTITSGDEIVFGSLFCVPVDKAVRDFKYEINSTANTVTTRFNSIDNVTSDEVVEMVVAAEAIDNADGRYEATSFANLQKAINDAKATLINDETSGDDNALALFKAEVANLYKLEEVFRPKFVGSNTAREKATDEDVKNLSDYQKSLLGEHYIKIESSDLGKDINFVDVSATAQYPNSPVKDYTKYRDIYLYVVNNTGSFYYVPTFSSLIGTVPGSSIPFYDSTLWANSRQNSFKLNTTVTRCDIFDLTVNKGKPYDKYDVRYFVNNYTFDNGDGTTTTYYNKYKGPSRIQWKLLDSITEGSSLILGSMMGEKPIDVSDIGNVNSKATLIKYYAEKIANKGYENSAAVEETMELLGLTTVEVVRELNNTIGIEYPENPEYTLETAAIDHNVSFSLTNIPTGATVTVKYGDDVITDDNGDGYYEITVAKGKVLTIIPSCLTTEYTKTNITGRFSRDNNVALNVIPKLYQTTTTTRTERLLKDAGNLAKLSDGDFAGGDVTVNFTFKNKVDGVFGDDAYVNNYTPGKAFDFNQGSYDAYADLVYDLGRPTNINKFQHIAASDSSLAMGVYQIYASDSATNLFSEDSLICNYQNKDTEFWSGKKSQEIEFPTRTAQYVAIRCYMSVIKCDKSYSKDAVTGNHFYNCFRIGDIAIYGTPTNDIDYKVTEIQTPTSSADDPTDVEDGDLLNDKTFKSIKAYEDGEFKGAGIAVSETNLGKLNSQDYYASGHADINCGVKYYQNGECKNGYSFDRSNRNGNITFTVPTEAPTVYYDFTYDLGDYYAVNRVDMYTNSSDNRRVQAYEVYIGNDLDTLYTGTPVAVYNNYYNVYGQKIEFDKAKICKYVGYRVLNPGTENDDGNTYLRIDELAAYGNKVTSATDENLKPKGRLSSESVFLWNKDDSSVYTGDDDKIQYTAARLSVKYQSPKDTETGLVDTSKILLANGDSANIVERNVIAISKEKYTANSLTTLDISTADAKHSTATGEALNKCWKTNGHDVYAVYKLNNIKLTQKDLGFVVVGRIVYEYNGTYYTEYSPVFGADKDISAQSVYDAAFGSESNQGWFKQ